MALLYLLHLGRFVVVVRERFVDVSAIYIVFLGHLLGF
jgi:hypothetical protein